MAKTHNLKRRREASRKRLMERLSKFKNLTTARTAEQADNRRRLLAGLDPETRKWTEKEFAQLGLTQ